MTRPHECCPDRLFASRHPGVHAWLREWRSGHLNFEEVLIGMVHTLEEQNERLIKQLGATLPTIVNLPSSSLGPEYPDIRPP